MAGFTSFSVFFQVLINGIFLGCMYAVAAIGLSLIFGSMQIIFIAQGAVMILAAYCIYWIVTLTFIDPFFGFFVILPIFLGFGWVMYKGLFQRAAKAGKNPSLLLAFGIMILLEHLMSLIWTPNTRSVTTSYSTSTFSLGSINISITRCIVSIAALIATGFVFLFLKKTMLGKAVRGVSEDMRTAALLGISPSGISSVTFAIGIALAGVAGVATCITYAFDPYFGFLFSLKALIAVAFGGLGSVVGALLGGIALGVLESLSSYMISAGWADAVAYAAFLLILVLRPEGLMGHRSAEKAQSKIMMRLSLSKQKTGHLFAPILLIFFLIYPFLVNAETSYMVYFFYTTFIYVALAQGWNLVAGYAGQVSLGQHAFFGIGCYVTAITWRAGWTGYFDPLAMLMSGMGAALVAIVIGLPLLAKLRGDYFALGTLGLGEILRVIALNGGRFTEGAEGIGLPSSVYLSMSYYYFIALLIAVITLASLWFMTRSDIGLALVAIREDETAAAANGINTLKYKILAFAVGAFVTGLCGSLNAYYSFHVHTGGAFNLNWVIIPILMAILGGAGTFWGPILGAFILATIFELANIWMPELHPIFSAAFIVLVTLFLPDGLVSYITGYWHGILRKLSPFKWILQKT